MFQACPDCGSEIGESEPGCFHCMDAELYDAEYRVKNPCGEIHGGNDECGVGYDAGRGFHAGREYFGSDA